MRHAPIAAFASIVLLTAPVLQAQPRRLQVDDLFALKDVGPPVLSRDGRLVAYTVRSMDLKKDASDSDIYVVPFAGGEPRRMTASPKAETSPKFSPDGQWLAFLSARDEDKSQVWLLPLGGGEATKLTDMPGGVSAFAWAPDSKRLVLVAEDPDPDAPKKDATADEKKTVKPIVTRRLQFKRDGEGYLRELRSHLYLFDLVRKTPVQITTGPYDASAPEFSPDGQWIAFVSNRTTEPDANRDTNVFIMAPVPGETPRALTTNPGEDERPAWSPDSRSIAYLASGDVKDMWYATNHVALVDVASGQVRPLTRALDRNAGTPRFSPDGRSVLFTLEDGGNSHLARVPVAGGTVERIVNGERDVMGFDAAGTSLAFLESQPHVPPEIVALDGSTPRRLTKVNDAVLAGIQLAPVERFRATSRDGTPVDAFLTRPPGAKPGERFPTILVIHGGPVSQFSTAFDCDRQLFAAHGYAVVAANPRGSSGYGRDFAYALWARWGEPDFDDVMAAVDKAIEMGVADPERLGVGGWSYGGILTNYVISKTTRFKVATSGASISNIIAGYGTDHYQYEYEVELGLPWQAKDAYLQLSSPFLNADRIRTPTLFLCGQDDMNVPLLNSEQMYQALRRLGVPTELVIYPGENHVVRKPTYQKDLYERYLQWYDRYLRPEQVKTPQATTEVTGLDGRRFAAPELSAEARQRLEANLAQATSDFIKNPESADAIIWLGRRLAYLSRYREAIDVFSRGIAKFPGDPRMYRHRGHRYITTRQFDKAVADLEKAAVLVRNRPNEGEPDGAPGKRPSPSSTLNFNVYYHLGLAYYLQGRFDRALPAYRECMKFSTDNDDSLVATSDWLYMTLRRLGRADEAAKVLEPIKEGMTVLDNDAYYKRLLMYKGLRRPEDVMAADETDPLQIATQGYGVANFYFVDGDPERAKALLRRVLAGSQWAAFGFIAAEADLERIK